MIIERHQGLKLFRVTGETQRPMDLHKIMLKEIPNQIEMNVRFSYNSNPETVLTGSEEPTEFYTIEINKIGFRFENLEIANVYFDIFTNFKAYNEYAEIIDHIRENHSSWLI